MHAIALQRKLRIERLEERCLLAVMLSVDATANLHAIDPRIDGKHVAVSHWTGC